MEHLHYQHAWNEINDPDEVMSRLLLCNKLHLYQAWDTPCATGQLKEYFGTHSLGHGAKDTIDRKFDPNVAANLPE
eukprot:14340507-Ditylum_brightwellii.AAC.1